MKIIYLLPFVPFNTNNNKVYYKLMVYNNIYN